MTDEDLRRLAAIRREVSVYHPEWRVRCDDAFLLRLIDALLAANADLSAQVDTLRRDSDAYARGLLDAAEVVRGYVLPPSPGMSGIGTIGRMLVRISDDLRAMADGKAVAPSDLPDREPVMNDVETLLEEGRQRVYTPEGQRLVNATLTRQCPTCDGSGVADVRAGTCPVCDGTGREAI